MSARPLALLRRPRLRPAGITAARLPRLL